jgi:hypothetical protein
MNGDCFTILTAGILLFTVQCEQWNKLGSLKVIMQFLSRAE